jgi:hypothetical protein
MHFQSVPTYFCRGGPPASSVISPSRCPVTLNFPENHLELNLSLSLLQLVLRRLDVKACGIGLLHRVHVSKVLDHPGYMLGA